MRLPPRLRTRSLRGRLAWSATAVVAAWVLLLALGANVLLGSALAGEADSVLRARAEATATTLDVARSGTVSVDEAGDDRALDVGTWIFAGQGELVEGPPGSSALEDRAARRLAAGGRRTVEVGDEDPVRLFALPVTDGGTRVATVVTSTSLAPYRQLERLALWGSAAVALLLLVIVHLVLRANVGRALRPVQQMGEQAARWSADDSADDGDRRLSQQPRPTELAELAATLDGVLDRLSAVLRHEQRLTDELSHELRTPLARLRAEVELAQQRRPDDPEVSAGLAAVDAAAGDMQRTIETLLTSARAGARSAPGRCAPAAVLDALLAVAVPPSGVRVEVHVDPALVVGVDGAVLQRLLAPVLDNALRYAAGSVTVRAERHGDGVVLTVTDDGPGVAAADVERVLRPGWRADPDDDHPGGGLGLALAARLAAASAGSISVRPGPGGRFDVRLPPG